MSLDGSVEEQGAVTQEIARDDECLLSSIVKIIKRVMAAELSRERSAEVPAGYCERFGNSRNAYRRIGHELKCTKSKPISGPHLAFGFGFLTPAPNAPVDSIHPKAMPVILRTAEERDV